ncbi:hypothetical protein N7466_010480 [Penicillium verhagenii]|uniref:uncharacterized protein n=1 Tax=Penicillium verhagenii TaxID=1562060 RepID=UPI002544D55A|nr:uncharacterized protein N7466_010480 [Penicillium verhagenii]KAJ5918488.1 hypothetical protein N7466_010480 [Penicillium verhagenii]
MEEEEEEDRRGGGAPVHQFPVGLEQSRSGKQWSSALASDESILSTSDPRGVSPSKSGKGLSSGLSVSTISVLRDCSSWSRA